MGLSYEQMKSELDKLGTKQIPKFGVRPINVPGTVDAWFELHQKFGKLPINQDLAPANRLVLVSRSFFIQRLDFELSMLLN